MTLRAHREQNARRGSGRSGKPKTVQKRQAATAMSRAWEREERHRDVALPKHRSSARKGMKGGLRVPKANPSGSAGKTPPPTRMDGGF